MSENTKENLIMGAIILIISVVIFNGVLPLATKANEEARKNAETNEQTKINLTSCQGQLDRLSDQLVQRDTDNNRIDGLLNSVFEMDMRKEIKLNQNAIRLLQEVQSNLIF